jgi:hypothetical protein
MKRILPIVVLLLTNAACNKPDKIQESRQSYLVKHSWKYTSQWVNGSKQNLDVCLVDDVLTFGNSGSVLIIYGDIRCDLSQPQNVTGTYALSPDQNSLYITAGGTTATYAVNLIDEYNLDITQAQGWDSVRYRLNAR